MPTKKAEPPPTGDVNRDSGTDSANGGSGDWLGGWFMSQLALRVPLNICSRRLAAAGGKSSDKHDRCEGQK